jgi:hypothetical protein
VLKVDADTASLLVAVGLADGGAVLRRCSGPLSDRVGRKPVHR